MSEIHLKVTIDQANAIVDALDFYSRICIGQLQEVENLVRSEIIPMGVSSSLPRTVADVDACEKISDLMDMAKKVLGYPKNGSNGIGHPHISKSGLRSYEIKKVLEKTLAELREPNPTFRGVNYDGLGPRYTSDPAPKSWVE